MACLYAWMSIIHIPDNLWMVESNSTMMLDLERPDVDETGD